MGLMVPARARIERYVAATVPVLAAQMRRLLGTGGLCVLPTESFYGLAAALRRTGAGQVMAGEGPLRGKPILLLIGDRSQVAPLVQTIPPAATVLMNAFWPGPLTIVFPAALALSDAVTAGTGSVGIRLSGCQPLVDLLRQVGPVTGTSANREGLPPPCRAEDVQANLGEEVDLIVDAGPTPGGRPSTIVDVRGPIRIVREGAIERGVIAAQLAAQGLQLEAESR